MTAVGRSKREGKGGGAKKNKYKKQRERKRKETGEVRGRVQKKERRGCLVTV